MTCGCAERKDIMFTHGGLTVRKAALTVTTLCAVTLALYLIGRTVQ